MLELLFPNMSDHMIEIFTIFINFLEAVFWIVVVVAEWKIFKKFGDKPWKSLIMIWRSYVICKHVWNTRAFVGSLVSSTLFDILFLTSEYIALRSPESPWVTVTLLASVPFGILSAVFAILIGIRLAESFGKGTVFGVGLGVLYGLFVMALGLGKSKYLGNPSNPRTDKGETVDPGGQEANGNLQEAIKI